MLMVLGKIFFDLLDRVYSEKIIIDVWFLYLFVVDIRCINIV